MVTAFSNLSFQLQKVYIWTVIDWVLLFLWDFLHCKVLSYKLINKKKGLFFTTNLLSRKTERFFVQYVKKNLIG